MDSCVLRNVVEIDAEGHVVRNIIAKSLHVN